MKFISNCAAVFLIFCATLQAQTPTNVDGTYTIPITPKNMNPSMTFIFMQH